MAGDPLATGVNTLDRPGAGTRPPHTEYADGVPRKPAPMGRTAAPAADGPRPGRPAPVRGHFWAGQRAAVVGVMWRTCGTWGAGFGGGRPLPRPWSGPDSARSALADGWRPMAACPGSGAGSGPVRERSAARDLRHSPASRVAGPGGAHARGAGRGPAARVSLDGACEADRRPRRRARWVCRRTRLWTPGGPGDAPSGVAQEGLPRHRGWSGSYTEVPSG